jgi:hypothetical protein
VNGKLSLVSYSLILHTQSVANFKEGYCGMFSQFSLL